MRELVAVALVLLGSLTMCFGRQGKHSDRFPMVVDGKYGYMDRTGSVVKPQFDSAASFSDGLALVKTGGSYRYIDASGRPAFAGEYENAVGFSENLASVLLHDCGGGWGVITRTGKVISRLRTSRPVVFSDGRGRFGGWVGPLGYIDRAGDTVIKPVYPYPAGSFSEGLASVYVGGHQGYINKAGRVIIKGFDWVGDFHEGLAFFMDEGNPPDRWGYINKTGKVVIKPQFEKVGNFSEGLAPVKIDGKWGYIDRIGRMVITPQFAEVRSFSEGLAAVKVGDGPLWRLDVGGDELRRSREGGGSGFGYIDKTGKMVIRPQFERASDFSDGLAQVWVGGGTRWGAHGERWLPQQRSGASQYVDSYRWGYIYKTGKYVW